MQLSLTSFRTEGLLPVDAGSTSYHRQAGSLRKHMLDVQYDMNVMCCRVSSLHSHSLWPVCVIKLEHLILPPILHHPAQCFLHLQCSWSATFMEKVAARAPLGVRLGCWCAQKCTFADCSIFSAWCLAQSCLWLGTGGNSICSPGHLGVLLGTDERSHRPQGEDSHAVSHTCCGDLP